MNTFLWALQLLLGVLFFAHGLMLTLQPASMRGALEGLPHSKGFLRFIGLCEFLGGLGLILPWWLSTAPVLTPLAAAGLAVIMLGAALTHLCGRETPQVVVTSGLTVLLFVVAFVRWDGLV